LGAAQHGGGGASQLIRLSVRPPHEVKARRVTPEERGHIAGFIEAFVVRDHRDGWISALLEKPSKAGKRLGTVERQLDMRFCSLAEDANALLDALSNSSKVNRVCYFDSSVHGSLVALEEARERWGTNVSDAIVSFVPGKVAAFLFHEGWGWRCER
jgi:hypothetical protein